jgi:carbamoyl-phosphate synthase large subunit
MDEARAMRRADRFSHHRSPSFTLGGTGGGVAYNPKTWRNRQIRAGCQPDFTQVMLEESVLGWKEYELEVMRDHNGQRGDHLLH